MTLFEFRLHAVGPEIFGGLVVFPHDQAKSVLSQYRDFVGRLPQDLSVWAVLRQAPPLPFLPAEVHGKDVVVLAAFYCGKPADGPAAVAPLSGFGKAYGEHLGPMPYTAWQQAFDPLLTPGARNYWKSHNFSALSDEAIDTVIRYAGQLPSPQCEIFLGLIGGEASRPAPDATAYPHRDALYAMNVHTRWSDPAEDRKCIAWARAFFDAAAPYASGSVYVNFLTQEETGRDRRRLRAELPSAGAGEEPLRPAQPVPTNQNIAPTV